MRSYSSETCVFQKMVWLFLFYKLPLLNRTFSITIFAFYYYFIYTAFVNSYYRNSLKFDDRIRNRKQVAPLESLFPEIRHLHLNIVKAYLFLNFFNFSC